MYLSPRKKLFVETASKMFGVNATISKQNVREAAAEAGVPFPSWFIKGFKAHYGHFTLPLFVVSSILSLYLDLIFYFNN